MQLLPDVSDRFPCHFSWYASILRICSEINQPSHLKELIDDTTPGTGDVLQEQPGWRGSLRMGMGGWCEKTSVKRNLGEFSSWKNAKLVKRWFFFGARFWLVFGVTRACWSWWLFFSLGRWKSPWSVGSKLVFDYYDESRKTGKCIWKGSLLGMCLEYLRNWVLNIDGFQIRWLWQGFCMEFQVLY